MSDLKEKVSELLDVLGRVNLMSAQEISERSQEAAHYNWMDDENRRLEHLAMAKDVYVEELEAKIKALESLPYGTDTKRYAEAMQNRDWQTCDLICEEHSALVVKIKALEESTQSLRDQVKVLREGLELIKKGHMSAFGCHERADITLAKADQIEKERE